MAAAARCHAQVTGQAGKAAAAIGAHRFQGGLRMIRKTIRIASVVVAASVAVVAPAKNSGAGLDCSSWLTAAFWHVATAEDVERCVAAGAKLEPRHMDHRETPLHRSALEDNTDLVNALIAAGAKIEARDERGSTPLHWAAMHGKTSTVNALIAAGAKIEPRNKRGVTPLHWAASQAIWRRVSSGLFRLKCHSVTESRRGD